jgi:hypothetical protein
VVALFEGLIGQRRAIEEPASMPLKASDGEDVVASHDFARRKVG